LIEVNKSKDQFEKIVSVIISNQSFMSTERLLAKKHRVTLWDKDDLYEMIFEDTVSKEYKKKLGIGR